MAAPAQSGGVSAPAKVDIKPLLSRLWPIHPDVTADEIAEAIALFFTNQVSDVQSGSLLMCLHFTGLDRRADVLAKCSAKMRKAAAQVDAATLRATVDKKRRPEGTYQGGLCDIVGTGGDSHNTFNISTTASIITSSLILMAKHGNRASTSRSGSADLLNNMLPSHPQIARVTARNVADVYEQTNYTFLFAPSFHPGMRFVAPIRRELPWRTIFNLLGPLSNPLDVRSPGAGASESLLEARVIGVARKDLGPVFAEALFLADAQKSMVVCGVEDLDEISCAGPTLCWRVYQKEEGTDAHQTGVENGDSSLGSAKSSAAKSAASKTTATTIEHFLLQPSDFGLPAHPLDSVSPGRMPAENAAILYRILHGELPDDDPILHFVLMNAAALFVVSGICDADSSDMGHGDDGAVITERGPGGGRWKEGVRRARWALRSGEAWRQWEKFVEVTNALPE